MEYMAKIITTIRAICATNFVKLYPGPFHHQQKSRVWCCRRKEKARSVTLHIFEKKQHGCYSSNDLRHSEDVELIKNHVIEVIGQRIGEFLVREDIGTIAIVHYQVENIRVGQNYLAVVKTLLENLSSTFRRPFARQLS